MSGSVARVSIGEGTADNSRSLDVLALADDLPAVTNGGANAPVRVPAIPNRSPTALALLSTSVTENDAAGTAVGTLTATDPDAGDTAVFSLVAGDGDTGNAAFTIDGNQLRLAVSPDFETRRSYLVRIRATDPGGLYRDQLFLIGVNDVIESPTRLSVAGLDAAKFEGNSGVTAFTFVVTRSGPLAEASSVRWDTEVGSGAFPSFRPVLYFPARGPGFASASDYAGGVLPTGTLNFAPGETSKVISIDVAGDTEVESHDQFGVRLYDAVGAEVDTDFSIAGQILDEDTKPRTTITNFAAGTEVVYSLTGANRATIAPVVSDKLEFISVDGVRYGRTLRAAGLDAGQLRDYDGNDLGGGNGWRLKGIAAVQPLSDGQSYILVNPGLQRWAQVAVGSNGRVDLGNYGPSGDTRVVTAYVDPLIALGVVAEGSPVDSQNRFANDLARDNLSVLSGADYDRDRSTDLFFKLNDHASDNRDAVFLRAILSSDGNMRYANYMDAAQMTGWMQATGVSSAVYASWLDDGVNLVPDRGPFSDDGASRLFSV